MLIIATTALLVTGCSKSDDDDNKPAEKNINETVAADAQLTLFEAAVVKAGLSSTLSSTANLTLFAPDDDALKKIDLNGDGVADLDTEAKIKALDAGATAILTTVLQYHLLTTKMMAADIPAGPNAEITTRGGKKAFATRNASGVYINGVKVKKPDIKATNGIIHIVERVLMPPMGNIVETIAVNTNFTYLVAASQRVGIDILNALSAPGPLTAFAPTNQAFIDAGYPTIASIQAASAATLKPILLNHVVSARIFSSDFVDAAQHTTQGGGKLTISLSGGAKVKGDGNTTAANITISDVMATNGVIHVVDKVLLP